MNEERISSEQLSPEDELIKAEEEAEKQRLLKFLLDELEEVLITKPKKSRDKGYGELKHEAFRLYYIEGYSVEDLLDNLAPIAKGYGFSVSYETLNNWLSGCRILETLCNHLFDEHRNIFEFRYLIDIIEATQLSDEEKRLIKSHWVGGESTFILGHKEVDFLNNKRGLREVAKKVKKAFMKQVKVAISRRLRKKRYD